MENKILNSINPRMLVDQVDGSTESMDSLPRTLNAIFIPFRNRWAYVNQLLSEIRWYEGPVYLLPSSLSDTKNVKWDKCQEVNVLYPMDSSFVAYFLNLRTSRHKHTKLHNLSLWDLSLKRNFALWYSRNKTYERVLLVDDDIRGLTQAKLNLGSKYLEKYVIAGCFVDDFPDTSVVGHLELMCGANEYMFLSGSFLFINVIKARGFFPNIYNEDWLFMLDHILDHSICSFGTIQQLSYNPFNNNIRALFQEFGDIISDGLYQLISTEKYDLRYNYCTWKEIITERRQLLELLKKHFSQPVYQQLINTIINVSVTIAPDDCLTFIEDYETDTIAWHSFLNGG